MKKLNIYYIYLFLINFSIVPSLFGLSRTYALISLSIGLIAKKWKIIYFKSYDIFYFGYILVRLLSLKRIEDILFLNADIAFFITIIIARIIRQKITFYDLNRIILYVSYINLFFTIIKAIFIGVDELYLGTYGISVGQLGAILPNIGIFYYLRYFQDLIKQHGRIRYLISLTSIILLGVYSEKKFFIILFFIVLFFYFLYSLILNKKFIIYFLKKILSKTVIYVISILSILIIFALSINPEVKYITSNYSANFLQFAIEYSSRSLDEDTSTGLYGATGDFVDKGNFMDENVSEGRLTLIKKSYKIISSNPLSSYGLGTFSYGRGNNKAAQQIEKLDLIGDVPFIWNMMLESNLFAGLFFSLFIFASFLNNIKKFIFFKDNDNFYFPLLLIFLIDIYTYSYASIYLPPLNVIFSFLFI